MSYRYSFDMEVEEQTAGSSNANIKQHSGNHFSRKEKCLIMNVLNYFKATMNIKAAVKEASKALCCSERSIYAIRKEDQITAVASSKKPMKRKGTQINDRLCVYDNDVQALIRRKVHDSFIANIPPTMNTMLCAVNVNLPN
uniref:Uncharacterized protein n=1 Tax=Photinus pyralis TaxID=7054 RepID=A0A1Y1N2A4_PHOPY